MMVLTSEVRPDLKSPPLFDSTFNICSESFTLITTELNINLPLTTQGHIDRNDQAA